MLCLDLLPSAGGMEDKGVINMASEAGDPWFGTEPVAEKQAKLSTYFLFKEK